jgi:hypothetical protein
MDPHSLWPAGSGSALGMQIRILIQLTKIKVRKTNNFLLCLVLQKTHGSGSTWNHIDFVSLIWICIDLNCCIWIRIRIETNGNPKHCL